MSFSTRFMRRSSPSKTPFSKILNPFKLDRRRRSKGPSLSKKSTPSPVKKNSPSPNTKRKVIGEETYLVTTTSMKKLPPPPKPARSTVPTPMKHNLITVQGVKYNVSDNGRKLLRVEHKPEQIAPLTNFGVSKKLFLEGEEYVEDEPGVLVRSRNSMTRQSITNYRNRSINTIIKSQTRAKQYCMFFNKFGKCNKREKGVCPYIHDPDKVAVCRKFLMGNCLNDKCLLSHEVAPEKMPSCKFFLEGVCSRDNCPYRHIKVNPTAEACPEFMKGFCSAGENCKKTTHLHMSGVCFFRKVLK
ncbi:Zinc finger CCCH domain-containing protein 7,Zinc finger CCCH domain-containing protein 3 [Lepeophtheirus salmonis]|uniref:Zinc finger CCCH domain-containing protein 3 n=1 Tax=Lepeophtheirus salmonis TaxID=72036 RepID=A0A7R8D0F8_LEPSM|nr:Zinc finger CCCH domain-containing protein 7,Zinc finger CCCH domain-containing protein 3 [Lepeophtheirus salmonis]CAF2984000.1 Zinc finger CCCH domain-containing protein 7,Zinc finger CCCH domain-containing protein 3 [Lepeophtheirus salmonis]